MAQNTTAQSTTAQKVRDVMTADPVVLSTDDKVDEAAKAMRQHDIGAVLVRGDGTGLGVVTDRDIVVRAVAAGKDPHATTLGDVWSAELTTVRPDEDLDRAIQLMREHALRRVPVVEDDQPVGIVSLGDLAMERDERSVLADVSAAAPNH